MQAKASVGYRNYWQWPMGSNRPDHRASVGRFPMLALIKIPRVLVLDGGLSHSPFFLLLLLLFLFLFLFIFAFCQSFGSVVLVRVLLHHGQSVRCGRGYVISNRPSYILISEGKQLLTINLGRSTVAKHNTQESCWVILYGKVYDVWIRLSLFPFSGSGKSSS